MKKIKISIILNLIIVLLVLLSSIIMFTGIKFMAGPDIVLESTKLGMFRFFTVDSNLFMGLVALIMMIQEIKLLKGTIKKIDKKYYILKLMGTTAVSLTFITVFGYLGFIAENGLISLLLNSNLFFHLIIPITCIITFIGFERCKELVMKDTLWGIVPTLIYGIYYLLNILMHMENGMISHKYDWYWFVQGDIKAMFFVFPLMLFISYSISLFLWKVNKE